MAMTSFKTRKASETAKELLEEKICKIKEKNETKVAKVAERKAKIEAEKAFKAKVLY